MASYKITLYCNSGYNVINTPDTPARLSADATVISTIPNIEILQDRHLGSVIIQATDNQVRDADYIKVGSMYYAITSYEMQSVNTVKLNLVQKALLSVGGISVSENGVTANFDILDGITDRCTVSDDSWGKYTAEDPLTAPQEPLELQTEWKNPSGGNVPATVDGDPVLVETTVDLVGTLCNDLGSVYTDDETGESVVVPSVIPVVEDSKFSVDGVSKSDGTRVYVRNDKYQDTAAGTVTNNAENSITNGMSNVRALGIEQGSILNQWRVPKEFVGGIDITYYGIPYGNITESGTSYERQDQTVKSVSGVSGVLNSGISPDYATVKNKRLLYGTYNKYGMITCSGNSAEFKPEDLEAGQEKAPAVSYKSDPRPKGKPYYRFTFINSDGEFWRNAIAGSEWENVPLVYQGASGSALTRLNFDNERRIASLQKDQYETHYTMQAANYGAQIGDAIMQTIAGGSMMTSSMGVGSYAGMVSPGLEGVYSRGLQQVTGGLSGLLTQGVNLANANAEKNMYQQRYNAEKANELSGLYQATEVYAPTVNFPYNADILRDVKNNGVLIYKYRLSDADVQRIDKLLTMYGYKTAEPLTLSHFGRRQKFDYVACASVTVTGQPKWLCDDIADELKNGIRIWHTKPTSSAYDNNPIRS